MAFEKGTFGADQVGQLVGSGWVEKRGMQVGAYLGDHKSGPAVGQRAAFQAGVQLVEKGGEVGDIDQPAMYLFGADLIGDGGLWPGGRVRSTVGSIWSRL
jgi:hypothetical protein